jgi:peptidoglycan/LPS O-acetylase OafA/YrhL
VAWREEINQELREILSAKVIAGLDALRALAITLVLVDHLWLDGRVTGALLQAGAMGVMIFFVLSGFLITSMLLKEYRKSGTISLRNFYRRRAFRIFPTFYACWILTTIVEAWTRQIHWATAPISFFYLMDYGRAFASDALLPHMHMVISWSLAVEEKFYLLWPLLLLSLLHKRVRLSHALCLIVLAQWAYRAVLFLGFHVRWNYVYSTFDMRADALLIGCLLAVVVSKDRTRLALCWLLRWQWSSAIPLLALAVISLLPGSHPALYITLWSLQPVIIAAWLLQFVYWSAKSWHVCGTFPVRFFAHISYALYLYHPLAGEIVYAALGPHHGVIDACLIFAMATASYYCIERPFMRMRDHASRQAPALAIAK